MTLFSTLFFRAAPLFTLTMLCANCAGGLAETRFASAQDRATQQERVSCGDTTNELDDRLISPNIVQSAEPLYSITHSKHGVERRLLGAQLRVPAQPGLTAEWLERALKCHGARRARNEAMSPPPNPYWLPHGFVDIAVQASGDGFNVHLRGEDSETSQRILDRARAFTLAIGG